LIETALKKYQDTLASLSAGQTNAQRNVEFRVAYLRALLAEDDPQDMKARDLAIAKLKEFTTRHPDTWQIGRALKTLAELQVEAKDYAEAEQTYRALAQANVAEVLKEHATLLAATVQARAGNFAAAEKNLRALAASLPKGSRQSQRAQIALGEALVEAQKLEPAKNVLQQVINETKDPELKAAAYNGLGICLYTGKQYQDARWNFLWVDVMFDQDKAEHAKALYYLWKIAENLNEAQRARESLDLLLNNRDFTGTEYQRKAQNETAK
jgi:TolA-binding protein